jgi:hypothetical protein
LALLQEIDPSIEKITKSNIQEASFTAIHTILLKSFHHSPNRQYCLKNSVKLDLSLSRYALLFHKIMTTPEIASQISDPAMASLKEILEESYPVLSSSKQALIMPY